MERRPLGDTGISVSVLCLGTMTFGEQNTEAEAFAQLDRAVEAGINFIDTAEMYPIPPRAETCGRTETIIGRWLARRGRRDDLVIATKVTGPGLAHIRGGHPRHRRDAIRQAVTGSLRRLGVEAIDLYQVHWPDRDANFFGKLGYRPGGDPGTPIEETLEALTELLRDGLVRAVGVSNETPWGAMRYLCAAEQRDLARIASIQNPYSLLNRSYEVGLAEISHREGVGLLAYSPLGFGTLTGKYLEDAPPTARLKRFPHYRRYLTEAGVAATREYVALARRHGLSPAQMALAYVVSRPFLTSAIIGATSPAQLEENLGSAALKLSEEVLEGIEAVHARYTIPCP